MRHLPCRTRSPAARHCSVSPTRPMGRSPTLIPGLASCSRPSLPCRRPRAGQAFHGAACAPPPGPLARAARGAHAAALRNLARQGGRPGATSPSPCCCRPCLGSDDRRSISARASSPRVVFGCRLNIVVGLAGLLDLGRAASHAVGAQRLRPARPASRHRSPGRAPAGGALFGDPGHHPRPPGAAAAP